MEDETHEAHYCSGADYLLRGRGNSAAAQSCDSKAVSANGKPLHGAAKMSFVRKCKRDTCGSKAVSADGKPLHGAAKNSFMGSYEDPLRAPPGPARCGRSITQACAADNQRLRTGVGFQPLLKCSSPTSSQAPKALRRA